MLEDDQRVDAPPGKRPRRSPSDDPSPQTTRLRDDRLLRPLMASAQPTPPALRGALRAIGRQVFLRIAAARLPSAA